jgi:hypothetical protein
MPVNEISDRQVTITSPLPFCENGKLGVKFTSPALFFKGSFGLFLELYSEYGVTCWYGTELDNRRNKAQCG